MEVLGRDWDVGACADLPVEHFYLHAEAAELDSDFADKSIEWREFIYDSEVPGLTLLVVEQSCANGVLLPWDQRGVRLLSAPWEGLLRLDRFNRACPRHVAAFVAHELYWVVRSERARRTGSPHWSPRFSKTAARYSRPLDEREGRRSNE